MTPIDEELLAGIAAQDRGAFTALYDRYAPRLLGLLVHMLSERAEAEDVLQEVFWQVWTRASQYDPQRSSPQVWLVMIARSRARDRLRSRRPAPASPILDALATPDSDGPTQSEHLEQTRLAREALASLPDEQRSAITLAFFAGLTHEDIAARESIPLGTVKTRIRRGMIRLREIFDGPKGGGIMNQQHPPFGNPAEAAALYAAGALRDDEAAAFESHVAGCDPCAAELRRLDATVQDLFACAHPVSPDPRTREALLHRIDRAVAAGDGPPTNNPSTHRSAESDAAEKNPCLDRAMPRPNPQIWKRWLPDAVGQDLLVRRAADADWEPSGISGIDIRRLFLDPERDQMTALVRMAAGTAYPRHVHNGPEECYVLQGDLHVGDTVLKAGDYQYAPPGSRHPIQSTPNGCLLLIVSSLSDDIED